MKQLVLCLLLIILMLVDATQRYISGLKSRQHSQNHPIASIQNLDENSYYESLREPGW